MRRKPLGRWGKIGRNVLLTLLAGALIWLLQGAPPFTAEGELWRLERESFLTGHSQFQGSFSSNNRSWVLGLTEDWVVFGDLRRDQLSFWPREGEGPVLAPSPEEFSLADQIFFTAVNVPEGTASAQLSLTLSCWYTHVGTSTNGTWSYGAVQEPDQDGSVPRYWEQTWSAQGEPLEEGAFLFRLEMPEEDRDISYYVFYQAANWDTYWDRNYQTEPRLLPVSCRAEAVFLDAAGTEVGRAELSDIVHRETL